jgi:D-arabinitol 4-dehydrogenase
MNLYDTVELVTGNYNPKDCNIGILHVGPGNFHRAHQAVYIHRLMSETNDLKWGIAGVNLRPESKELLDDFKKCDGSYILETISPEGDFVHEKIDSIVGLYDWDDEKNKVLALFVSNDLKMITVTVTESGYSINNDRTLDTKANEIIEDSKFKSTKTIYGFLYEGLSHRMDSNGGPITIACCDNLQNNGKLLESCFKDFISLQNNSKLLDWVNNNVSFPCSMVDRITPKPNPNSVQLICSQYNLNGNCVVIGEDYLQWVLEDSFISERPQLEKVGVQVVKDVHPYEETKIRILNAGHTTLTYFGVLEGYKTYDEAVTDQKLTVFFDNIQEREIIPALPDEYPINYQQYVSTTKNRFTNKHIADSLERICMDGVEKFKVFLHPTIKGNLENGNIPIYSIQGIASWYVFATKFLEGKLTIGYHEPSWDILKTFLSEDRIDDFSSSEIFWGDIPKKHPEFSKHLSEEIRTMKHKYQEWP